MKWGFCSCMRSLDWGGSEELWSQAALRLLDLGESVFVNYRHLDRPPERLARIQSAGGHITWRRRWVESAQKRWASRLPNRWLLKDAPDFVTITLGLHTDDLAIAHACRRHRVPYAINVQCACESSWIEASKLDATRAAYRDARAVLFLSRANQEIVEANLGCRIDHARIIDNPYQVDWRARESTWPSHDNVWKLACVGRLSFTSKGQDLVVRALQRERWRSRPLQVVFWGQDHGSGRPLERLIEKYGMQKQAMIAGFSRDIQNLWSEHHGLLLPSRYEGLPMVTVEAMLSGRPAIATACGRNADLIDDEETGFLIAAPTVELVDETLERAWRQRSHWRQMGDLAAERIRERYSGDPVRDFVGLLQQCAQMSAASAAA